MKGRVNFQYIDGNTIISDNNLIKIEAYEDKVIISFFRNDETKTYQLAPKECGTNYSVRKFLSNMRYDRLNHIHTLTSGDWMRRIKNRSFGVYFDKY